MPAHQKASDAQIIEAYERLHSVWAVAKLFDMCGQSVHERAVKLGISKPVNVITNSDRNRLIAEYETHASTGTLAVLAASMGRSKHLIAREARTLGLTDGKRKKPYSSGTISRNMKRWHSENQHPKGMLGKNHSPEVCAAMGVIRMRKTRLANGTLYGVKPHGLWKAAWREIGGTRKFYRSSWEANYARYLEWLKAKGEIAKWEHEPETFWFEKIVRGTCSYLPDFRVTELNGAIVYHEVKGWMDGRSKTKLRRMKKYYPQIKVVLIDSKSYQKLAKVVCRLIEGWEFDGR